MSKKQLLEQNIDALNIFSENLIKSENKIYLKIDIGDPESNENLKNNLLNILETVTKKMHDDDKKMFRGLAKLLGPCDTPSSINKTSLEYSITQSTALKILAILTESHNKSLIKIAH